MKVNNNRDMILCRIGVNLISQNYLCRPHSGQFAFIQSKIEIWKGLFLLFDTVIRLHIKRLRLAYEFEHSHTHKQTSNFAINKYINFQVVSVIQTQIQHTNSNRVVFGSIFFTLAKYLLVCYWNVPVHLKLIKTRIYFNSWPLAKRTV